LREIVTSICRQFPFQLKFQVTSVYDRVQRDTSQLLCRFLLVFLFTARLSSRILTETFVELRFRRALFSRNRGEVHFPAPTRGGEVHLPTSGASAAPADVPGTPRQRGSRAAVTTGRGPGRHGARPSTRAAAGQTASSSGRQAL